MFIFTGVLLLFVFEVIFEVGSREVNLPNGAVIRVEDEYKLARESGGTMLRSKKMLKNNHLLWKSAAVIYQVDVDIGCPDSDKCLAIKKAMYEYTRKTCIRFKERSGEINYVRFMETRIKGGDSHLGCRGGEQHIRINSHAWIKSLIMHELGHTVGLIDEHTRPDRDYYVDILYDNIDPKFISSFRKFLPEDVNLLGEPFDHKSIMMYADTTFSKKPPKLKTLRLKSGAPLKGNTKLSAGDVRRIDDLYRCEGADQKPSFPHDIVCSFDDNDCGFKGILDSAWTWIPRNVIMTSKSTGTFVGGYLESALGPEDRSLFTRSQIWSVNFYGLSPLDEERGPEGCVNFLYFFDTVERGILSLRLYKTDLSSPLDLGFESDRSFVIWTSFAGNNLGINPTKWYRASVPIYVSRPFALGLVSVIMGVENEKSVRVDEFEVRYAACEYPTVNGVDGITTSPKSEWVGLLTSLLLKATSTPSLGRSYSIQSSSRASSRSSSLLSRPSSRSSSLLSRPSSSSSSFLSRPSSRSPSRSSKSSSSLSSRSSSRTSPVSSFGGSSKSWAKDLVSYLASLSP